MKGERYGKHVKEYFKKLGHYEECWEPEGDATGEKDRYIYIYQKGRI